ncbi:MAG: hypothetical protein QM778_18500 [Myxococcales bacterium]
MKNGWINTGVLAVACVIAASGAAQVEAQDRGERAKQWCDSYHGRADTEHYCAGLVNFCWDVCVLPDTSKNHFEGPYPCGVCFGWNF